MWIKTWHFLVRIYFCLLPTLCFQLRFCSFLNLLSNPRQMRLKTEFTCPSTSHLNDYLSHSKYLLLLTLPVLLYHFFPLFNTKTQLPPPFIPDAYPSSSSNVVATQSEQWPGSYEKPIRSGGVKTWERSNWEKRTELPQVLSDGQPEEPKSGERDKTQRPRDYIKSILLFQCNGDIYS